VSGPTRFVVRPCGAGSWGLYDNHDRRWVNAYTGPQARETAEQRQRERAEPQPRLRTHRRSR